MRLIVAVLAGRFCTMAYIAQVYDEQFSQVVVQKLSSESTPNFFHHPTIFPSLIRLYRHGYDINCGCADGRTG